MRARYYDSVTGTFTQEDPIKDGSNWYSYCMGNPVVFTDPSGLRVVLQESYKIAGDGTTPAPKKKHQEEAVPALSEEEFDYKNYEVADPVPDPTPEPGEDPKYSKDSEVDSNKNSIHKQNDDEEKKSNNIIEEPKNLIKVFADSWNFQACVGTGFGASFEVLSIGIDATAAAEIGVVHSKGETRFDNDMGTLGFTAALPIGSIGPRAIKDDDDEIKIEWYDRELTLFSLGGYFVFGGKVSVSFDLGYFIDNWFS